MLDIFKHLQGDRAIWAVVALLALLSFMPVYSASTNLVYVVGNGSTMGHLLKHAFLLTLGFGIMFGVHKIPYRYFGGGVMLMLPLVIVLLIATLSQGTTIGGANASRWIRIPVLGVGFQTSTLASIVLMVFTARFVAKNKDAEIDFVHSLKYFWLPVGLTLFFILPANFSTTAIVFFMILVMVFLGGYPVKYILRIIGAGVFALALFVLVVKAFPGLSNRVATWEKRIENFADKDKEEGYQVQNAKIAIATGGVVGLGAGKSVQKNFLPQSSSDFIYAIIVEEWGIIGSSFLVILYALLLWRILIIAKKAGTVFGTMLVIAVGLPIIFQAIINMAVATNLLPVTGQTLPLISSGGTSIWMTCLGFGIILSVSSAIEVTEEELETENEDPLAILQETIHSDESID